MVKNINNTIFLMTEVAVEIYKKRINELLFAKINLLQIIAEHDESNTNETELVELIKWKIGSINKVITEMMDYINILLK